MRDIFSEFERVTPDLWQANEQEWKEKLEKLPNWYQIPLINCNDLHNLADGSLVRFRGMVQDMHNPEFYFEDFEVVNTVTGDVKRKSGKYRETAHILETEKVNYADNLKSAQRQTLVVISIPGLNEWAQEAEYKLNHLPHLHSQPSSSKRDSSATSFKRSYEDTEDCDMEHTDTEPAKEQKTTQETDAAPALVVSREHLLNFPLPDVPSKSCIVKLYNESEDVKLNELIEVVGFLCVDAALSGEFQQDGLELEEEAERVTLRPPPSLVPRVHAVYTRKLTHCNPLYTDVHTESLESVALEARSHLMKVLTELLLGDELAAEYLVCQLVAGVYLRQETLTLGQCSVNIGALASRPALATLPARLQAALADVVTHSYLLPLTIDNLNNMDLLPKKDYTCNRLSSGVLQLPAGTLLLLDESALSTGVLQPRAVRSLRALSSLLQEQKVEYDFKYYTMQFEADVRVLVLSEGRSMLPCEYYIPLVRGAEAARDAAEYEARSAAAGRYLRQPHVLACVRHFLTRVKHVQYTAAEDVKFVEDDFVEMRRTSDADEATLHRLLALARLVGLSAGDNTLRQAHWQRARELEARRGQRIQPQPTT